MHLLPVRDDIAVRPFFLLLLRLPFPTLHTFPSFWAAAKSKLHKVSAGGQASSIKFVRAC